jgi:hypothetical protein
VVGDTHVVPLTVAAVPERERVGSVPTVPSIVYLHVWL